MYRTATVILVVISDWILGVHSVCVHLQSSEDPPESYLNCSFITLEIINKEHHKDAISNLTIVYLKEDALPPKAFDYPNLSSLTITRSRFKFHPQAFSNLENLVELHLDKNQLNLKEFHDLDYVQVVTLRGNSIATIPPRTFEHMRRLEVLDLSENLLEQISFSRIIQHSVALERINLYSNEIKTLVAPESKCNVKEIDLSYNKLTEINKDLFEHFWLLRSLNLSSNRIKSLDHDAFRGNKFLKHLDLSNNRISTLSPDVFHQLTHLNSLDLSLNQLLELPSEIFQHLRALESLSIISNCIRNVSNILNPLKNLSKLSIRTIRGTLPGHLRELRLITRPGCDSFNQVSSGDLLKVETLKTLVIYRREVIINHNTLAFTPLKHLEMIRCGLEDLPRDTFRPMRALEYLDLSVNKFKVLPEGIFETLANLDTLILRECDLTVLEPVSFAPLVSLASLNVDGNKIEVFQPTFFNLPSLRRVSARLNQISHLSSDLLRGNCFVMSLDVRNNLIRTFPRDFFEGNFLKEVEFAGNPIHCDCLGRIQEEMKEEKIYMSEVFDRKSCVSSSSSDCSPSHSELMANAAPRIYSIPYRVLTLWVVVLGWVGVEINRFPTI